MGKNKRRKLDSKSSRASHPTAKHAASRITKPNTKIPPHQSKSKPHIQAQHKPTVPFSATDNILLVGEGDFSFTRSLVRHHQDKFATLCATCFDSRDELLEKYPQAEGHITAILAPPEEEHLEDATDGAANPNSEDINVEDTFEDGASFSSFGEPDGPPQSRQRKADSCSVLYSVDATQVSKYKPLRIRKWDRIVFNFPHVGGKSTDVNRQVRYNQALIHTFLQAAKSLLSKPHGTILVTIFEGVPYDLWNIRDLARSAGLIVSKSSAFDASLYPGYAHARTLGNIRAKGKAPMEGDGQMVGEDGENSDRAGDEEDIDGKADVEMMNNLRPGKWRGEDRKARTYEFGLPEEVRRRRTGKKRKRNEKAKAEDGISSTDED